MFRDYLFEFSPSIGLGIPSVLEAQEQFVRKFAIPFPESIAELGMRRVEEDLMNILTPAMPMVLANMYAPPLSEFGSLGLSQSISEVLQENFLGFGKSVAGLGIGLEMMAESLEQNASASLLFPLVQPGQFINSLPNSILSVDTGIWATLQDAAEGELALDESGFAFTFYLLNLRSRAEFAGLSPRIRAAVVTRRLLDFTRTTEFEAELLDLLEASVFLRHRAQSVKLALAAHRSRHYALSIPALLPHVEGAIRDALVLKQLVIVQKHRNSSGAIETKLFAKDPNGPSVKIGKKGSPIELTKAKMLLDHADLTAHPHLEGAGTALTELVLPRRNTILHGHKNRLTTAALSTQALLLLFLIASDIVAFELGNV